MLDSFTKWGFILAIGLGACSTGSHSGDSNQMIDNPFAHYTPQQNESSKNITYRSKRGDQSVEVEIPGGHGDFSVPMNHDSGPAYGQNHGQNSENGVDYSYRDTKPTASDHEITSTFSKNKDPEAEAKKHEIEATLGLQASDDAIHQDESYLSRVDVVKQLFKHGRYEAAMIDLDRLVRDYPTNSRVYEMRGTILDRMGYLDLALKSWKQALELEPTRLGLKKLIEKKEQQRSVASERK